MIGKIKGKNNSESGDLGQVYFWAIGGNGKTDRGFCVYSHRKYPKEENFTKDITFVTTFSWTLPQPEFFFCGYYGSVLCILINFLRVSTKFWQHYRR